MNKENLHRNLNLAESVVQVQSFEAKKNNIFPLLEIFMSDL